MIAFRNDFANGRFARTQPREWTFLSFGEAPSFYTGRIRDGVQPYAHVLEYHRHQQIAYLRERGLYRLDVKGNKIKGAK